MENKNDIKEVVKEKYGEIAVKSRSCCGSSKAVDYEVLENGYQNIEGYVKDADLGLGCGIPTKFAAIKSGDTVVDLGSGAGNDVFVARALVGDSGKVVGLDFTDEMIEKANENKNKLGFKNVEFKLGDIEDMPIENEIADVVVSNCVLNLVPNKRKAFSEIFRILKQNGHFCVSDIVIKGDLPEQLRKSAEMYVGCVAGALQQDEYLITIKQAGFKNVEIKKSKTTNPPDDVLNNYLTPEEIKKFKDGKVGISSITVTGEK